MHVWTSAVCAAVGALVVASTGAAPAVLVLKLEIVALNNLRHGGAKKEVLPVVVRELFLINTNQVESRQNFSLSKKHPSI